MARGTKRIEQQAETRKRILGTAQGMFHRWGYESVSLRDIAAGAKCSTGALFSNFHGKDELFAVAMQQEVPDVEIFLRKVMAGSEAHTAIEYAQAVREFALEAERLLYALKGRG